MRKVVSRNSSTGIVPKNQITTVITFKLLFSTFKLNILIDDVENCVEMKWKHGQWNDVDCNIQ